jgi:hypothetical protein
MNMISAVTAKGALRFAAFEGTTTAAVGGVAVHGRTKAMR